ncbi:MAG: ABC transporter permease [bacterium]|nr:ABC transporter permease [bacterium]
MKSILLLIRGDFRKRKSTNISIGVVIAIAAMLFAAASGIMMNIDTTFDNMFHGLKAANLILSVRSDDYVPADLTGWWLTQSETISIAQYPLYSIPNDILVNGKKKEARAFIAERPKNQPDQDLLPFKEAAFDTAAAPPYPANGTIWVPSILAANCNIKIGDTIGVPGARGPVEYKVSAFVYDPQFNSAFGSKRLWIAPGSLHKLRSPLKPTRYHIAVRLNSTQKIPALLDQFKQSGTADVKTITYEQIKQPYLYLYKTAGGVVFGIAMLCLIISLFVITGNITSFIMSRYRQIGIIKAIGLTPKNVIAVYLLQTALLAVGFTLVGMTIGIIAAKQLLLALGNSVGIATVNAHLLPAALLTILTVPCLIILIALLNTFKAGKIKPAPAIRFGAPLKTSARKNLLQLEKMKRLPISLFLGIRNLYTLKRKMLYLMLSFVLMVTITNISIDTVTLLENSMEQAQFWGEPDADITILKTGGTSGRTDIFLATLKEHANIKSITTAGHSVWADIPGKGNSRPFSVIGGIYSANMADIGLENISGRHPSGLYEIALSRKLSEKYHIAIGDTIQLFIQGETKKFNVTALIQNVQNTGYNFRISNKTYAAIRPGYRPAFYYAKLKDTAAAQQTIKDIESRFGMQADAMLKSPTYNEIVGDFKNTMPAVKMMLLLVSFVFFIISFIFVNNDTVQYIGQSRKNFGILKSIGVTPFQLRMSSVYRILIQVFACLLIAVPFSSLLAPQVLNLAFGSIGFGAFPANLAIAPKLLLVPLFGIFGFLSAWIPSRRINKIKPKELVT